MAKHTKQKTNWKIAGKTTPKNQPWKPAAATNGREQLLYFTHFHIWKYFFASFYHYRIPITANPLTSLRGCWVGGTKHLWDLCLPDMFAFCICDMFENPVSAISCTKPGKKDMATPKRGAGSFPFCFLVFGAVIGCLRLCLHFCSCGCVCLRLESFHILWWGELRT